MPVSLLRVIHQLNNAKILKNRITLCLRTTVDKFGAHFQQLYRGDERMKKCNLLVILLVLSFMVSGIAEAQDWYVKEGAKKGKGTQEKPYKGIYKALAKAVKGDVIHVAQGNYSGKLKSGFIIIRTRNLTLLGGYNDDFSERDPFKYPTRIFKDPESKAQGLDVGLVKTEEDYKGLVMDGFILDATNRNSYDGKGDLQVTLSLKKPPITLSQEDCHLRNCVIMNAAHTGVIVRGAGSSIENCLIINTVYSGIHALGDGSADPTDAPILLRNNTILFTWKKGATGGYGIDIGTGCQVTMENNLIGYNENFAVSNQLNYTSDTIHTLNNNAMFQNKGGNYAFFSAENKTTLVIDDPDDLEDSDLEEAEDNVMADPFFKFDPEWFEKFANQTAAAEPGKLEMDDFNQLRSMLGLPLWGGTVEGRTGYGMAYPLTNILSGALWTTDNPELEGIGLNAAGPFAVITSAAEEKPQLDYAMVEFTDVFGSGGTYVEKPVAFKSWFVQEAMMYKDNSGNEYIKGFTQDSHTSIYLRGVPAMKTGMDTIIGYVEIGSAAEMYFKRKVATKGGGRGETKNSFIVKGVIRKPGGFINEGALVMEIHEMAKK